MSEQSKKLTTEEAKEWHQIIRQLIQHENELVNQRIGWLMQIQGLLFAALAFTWNDDSTGLRIILSSVGFMSSWSVSTAIGMYSPVVQGLNNLWNNNKPKEGEGPTYGPISGYAVPSKGFQRMLRPWRALPMLFCGAWIAVLIITLLPLFI